MYSIKDFTRDAVAVRRLVYPNIKTDLRTVSKAEKAHWKEQYLFYVNGVRDVRMSGSTLVLMSSKEDDNNFEGSQDG